MKQDRLYAEFIRRLELVNDETKTEHDHLLELARFDAWKAGVDYAAGIRFNGDYHYIGKIDSGEMKERPMCCGVFLDWESKQKG